MALNKSINKIEEVPIEEVTDNKISFEDLEFEGEFEEDNEIKKYFTISGKEQQYEPSWEKYGMKDLDVGDEFSGRVEITHFVNEGRKSDSLRVRVMDDGEIVDLYVNISKPDKKGFITNIRRSFDYYRTCYDFIYSVLRYRDEHNVVDANGEEINRWSKVNIINFAKYVDQMSRINIKITEGNETSDYNSFIITQME